MHARSKHVYMLPVAAIALLALLVYVAKASSDQVATAKARADPPPGRWTTSQPLSAASKRATQSEAQEKPYAAPHQARTPQDDAWELTVQTEDELERVRMLRDFFVSAEDPQELCDGCRLRFDAEQRRAIAARLARYLPELEAFHTKAQALASGHPRKEDVQAGARERSNLRRALFREFDVDTLFFLGTHGFLDTHHDFPDATDDLLVISPE